MLIEIKISKIRIRKNKWKSRTAWVIQTNCFQNCSETTFYKGFVYLSSKWHIPIAQGSHQRLQSRYHWHASAETRMGWVDWSIRQFLWHPRLVLWSIRLLQQRPFKILGSKTCWFGRFLAFSGIQGPGIISDGDVLDAYRYWCSLDPLHYLSYPFVLSISVKAA